MAGGNIYKGTREDPGLTYDDQGIDLPVLRGSSSRAHSIQKNVKRDNYGNASNSGPKDKLLKES